MGCNATFVSREYCRTLVNAEFYGETNSHIHEQHTDRNAVPHILNLGFYLQGIDRFLKEFDDINNLLGTEYDLLTYLKYIASTRKREGETEEECYERLLKDKDKFVELYKVRGRHSQTIVQKVLYWGSRQQFRAGKIVADHVDKNYGPLDPIYGILLNPTGGLLGRGDNSVLHRYFYDGSGMWAYHAAAHDSFGYLYKYHDIGPGYNYADPLPFCCKSSPYRGQLSGLWFWRRILKSSEKISAQDI